MINLLQNIKEYYTHRFILWPGEIYEILDDKNKNPQTL